jgi:hypothetical protein
MYGKVTRKKYVLARNANCKINSTALQTKLVIYFCILLYEMFNNYISCICEARKGIASLFLVIGA